MKILTVVGARPQFVKAAALSRAAKESGIREKLLHTGQHFDANMSAVFFEEMEIPKPDFTLGIGGLPQGAMTGRMIEEIEKVLLQERPDWVVVYGDTNSTLAGALAAVKLHLPLAHVEAGLRSFNKKMPEEINRLLTDHASEILFTPTEGAAEQLIKEGIEQRKIHQVGDIMADAALYYRKRADEKSAILETLQLTPKEYGLVTIHRQENTDAPEKLEAIIRSLCEVAEQLPIVFPLHPRTKKALEKADLFGLANEKLKLIDPVGYFDMIRLEGGAKVILTDSGGVQKEAYLFSVPCVTLRDETEWRELVENGFNRLSPPDCLEAFHAALDSEPNWSLSLYGGGDAASRILSVLQN